MLKAISVDLRINGHLQYIIVMGIIIIIFVVTIVYYDYYYIITVTKSPVFEH